MNQHEPMVPNNKKKQFILLHYLCYKEPTPIHSGQLNQKTIHRHFRIVSPKRTKSDHLLQHTPLQCIT